MPSLAPGDFLPDFQADSSVNPNFSFESLGGRAFLLAFVGTVRSELGRKLAEALLTQSDWLHARGLPLLVVTADGRDTDDPVLARLVERHTVFFDRKRTIARLFGLEATPAEAAPGTTVLRLGVLLVRPNLRLHQGIAASPLEVLPERLQAAVATLPEPEPGRLVQRQAPVLIVPDVFDPAACRRFIEHYEQHGGVESGFMRDIGGKTYGILDPRTKRRQDCYIKDPSLQQHLRSALTRRVVPEIKKAFAYDATRIERYMIACYDETDRGFFREHRDNRSKATAHRVFAVTLNLNSEDYEGGGLRFPEYGPDTYKPATGAAVVFSCSLLHEALPVTRGRRYVVLPFLYDDVAAQTRAEGRKFLNDGPPLRADERPGEHDPTAHVAMRHRDEAATM